LLTVKLALEIRSQAEAFLNQAIESQYVKLSKCFFPIVNRSLGAISSRSLP
jgi:hypothetical protein